MPRNKISDSIDKQNVEYKLIPNCDFEYYVTTDGRVWTNNRKNGIERFMKLICQDGYLSVGIHINGKQVRKRVHRLVAEAFIPNPENKPFINHIDGNRSNNVVSNLEWCTQAENVYHSIHILGKWSNSEYQKSLIAAEGIKRRKLDMETARQIRKEYATGNTSSIKLSKKYGLSKPCVLRIIHNESYKE